MTFPDVPLDPGFTPAPVDAGLVERLSAFSFVAGLSTAGKQLLEHNCQQLRFDSHQPLLTSGDACRALLLIERGAVRVSKCALNGREILLYRVTPGESCVLGTTCLLRQSDYPANAIAQAGTDALAVPAETFRYLHEREPSLRRFVMDLYALRLEEMMLLVEAVAFRRMDERLAELLLRRAHVDGSSWQPVEATHEALALELGTAREVISRLLTHFADDGSIALERRRVRILNPSALKIAAQPQK